VEEGYVDHLASYAYAGVVFKPFSKIWENFLNIYLASKPSTNDGLQAEALIKEGVDQHLLSYGYKSEEPAYNQVLTPDLRARVLIDSGAFTAWSTGKVIRPQDYAEWALGIEAKWRPKLKSLEFMNLDVIGDQAATWKNQETLEKLGLNPLPIVTYGVDLKHVDKALACYPYFALGGLVPYSRQKAKLQAWLDACFARVMTYRKKTGILRKVHLLGITSDWALRRYPCYSSDSSSWVACLRFGEAPASGLGRLPRYTTSDGAMAATLHSLRVSVRKYKIMETDATNLWKSRGITWDD
jgi:hypothetical protein